jgi:nitrate reductase gamma subunit
MTNPLKCLDPLLFAALPYVALFTFFLVTIQRYRRQTFTYSSLSSQFLENRRHFWAMVPFHYGVLGVLAGHILGLLIPRTVLLWNSVPLRLYVLEVTGLALGLLTLVGLASLIARRLSTSHVRVVTSPADWVLYALLVV